MKVRGDSRRRNSYHPEMHSDLDLDTIADVTYILLHSQSKSYLFHYYEMAE